MLSVSSSDCATSSRAKRESSRATLSIILCLAAIPLSASATPAAAAQSPAAQTTPSNSPAPAASAPPRIIISPEIAPDRRVTFRILAPNAHDVAILFLEGQKIPMQKDSEGLWSVTTEPLAPDFYIYFLVVDGLRIPDPANSLIKIGMAGPESLLHVPGTLSLLWEQNDVPHGTLHRHTYFSQVLLHETTYAVYTPPDYDQTAPGSQAAPSRTRLYPVLYLLHGYNDDWSAWTDVGRINVILDNLIARGRAKPMIVVMPTGYGLDWDKLRDAGSSSAVAVRDRNNSNFAATLTGEIMPQIESLYRASKDRNDHAIIGNSMGGAESLVAGLNGLDRFAWIGALSPGSLGDNLAAQFPSLAAGPKPTLLWIECGVDDRLMVFNRQLRTWLTQQDVAHVDVESPGGHSWQVWRRDVPTFLSLIFQPTPSR
jgi:enterochelin esterase-like enzyme